MSSLDTRVAEVEKTQAVMGNEMQHVLEKISDLIDQMKEQNGKLSELFSFSKRLGAIEVNIGHLNTVTEDLRLSKTKSETVFATLLTVAKSPITYLGVLMTALSLQALGINILDFVK